MNTLDIIRKYERFGSRLGMERIAGLCQRLGNPQDGLKVIHVAGTNGKGSVCRFLYEALRSLGYSVGLYTSPYIVDFNERIRLDGREISDEELTRIAQRVDAAAEEMVSEGQEAPTEFEVVTAIAFCYFAEKAPDFVILEVGLGGRGDSTNVVMEPLATVITSISMDHMDRLGNTIEEIAGEKAGIIKPGVPVFSNVEDEAAAKVIARRAYLLGSMLVDVTRLNTGRVAAGFGSYTFSTRIDGTLYDNVEISAIGRHQVRNCVTALSVLEYLRRQKVISVEKEALYEGIRAAHEPGRFEILRQGGQGNGPWVILDGAHNEAGAEALVETMEELFYEQRILMVVGMMRDKDCRSMLKYFSAITKDFICTEPSNPRSLDTASLAAEIEAAGGSCQCAKAPADAVRLALERGADYDAVVFAGSLYLVSDVRKILLENE